jgi:hypothetical protein
MVGVTFSTVRTQIRSIFSKTNVKRQETPGVVSCGEKISYTFCVKKGKDQTSAREKWADIALQTPSSAIVP